MEARAYCIDTREPMSEVWIGAVVRSMRAQRAMETRRQRYPNWNKKTPTTVQSWAHRCVAFAVKMGRLPKLDGSIACVDCGAPATQYEHRDYWRPIDVEPVCRSCNIRRGTA